MSKYDDPPCNARDSSSPLVALSALVMASIAPAAAFAACNSSKINVTVVSATLDFAQIFPCSSANTVTINPQNGNLTATGCLSTAGTSVRGRVRVTGGQTKQNDKVKVHITSSTITIGTGTGTLTMQVTAMDMAPKNGPPITQGGKQTIIYKFGGTLNVGANQGAGNYSGAVSVIASCL